nr:hypothetical protein Iba_chr09eCG10160 [Ipomoea batatas]
MTMLLKVAIPTRKVTPFMCGTCPPLQQLDNFRRFLRNLEPLSIMVFKSEVISRDFALVLWNLSL